MRFLSNEARSMDMDAQTAKKNKLRDRVDPRHTHIIHRTTLGITSTKIANVLLLRNNVSAREDYSVDFPWRPKKKRAYCGAEGRRRKMLLWWCAINNAAKQREALWRRVKEILRVRSDNKYQRLANARWGCYDSRLQIAADLWRGSVARGGREREKHVNRTRRWSATVKITLAIPRNQWRKDLRKKSL